MAPPRLLARFNVHIPFGNTPAGANHKVKIVRAVCVRLKKLDLIPVGNRTAVL
jgi:hypothetical protein